MDKDMLEALSALSIQLSQQAYVNPPVEGWITRFLSELLTKLASAGLVGVQATEVIGSAAVEIGRAGQVSTQTTRYELVQSATLAQIIRERQAQKIDGGRGYPIAIGSDAFGTLLGFIDREVQPGEPLDLMLTGLALQLGPALHHGSTAESGRHTGKLTHQIDILRSISEVTQSVSAALDTSEVMARATRLLVETLRLDHAAILLFGENDLFGNLVAEYPDSGMANMRVPLVPVISKRLAQERRPLVINRVEDAGQMGLDPASLEALGVRSVCIVPIMVDQALVGTVGLDSYYDYHDFLPEELEAAMAVTSQLGISIRNAGLFSEVSRQARQLEGLAELSRRINRTFEPSQIFRIVNDETRKMVDADQVSIALCRPEVAQLQLVVMNQADPVITNYEAIQTALNIACENPEPLVLDDISQSEYPDYHKLAETGIHSLMVVPLIAGGQAIGTLNIGHHEAAHYTEASVSVLDQIGNQLTAALENARRYNEIESRAETEQFLNRLSSAIQNHGTLQQMLLSALQEMANAMDAQRARIRLQVPSLPPAGDGIKLASLSKIADKLADKTSEKREN